MKMKVEKEMLQRVGKLKADLWSGSMSEKYCYAFICDADDRIRQIFDDAQNLIIVDLLSALVKKKITLKSMSDNGHRKKGRFGNWKTRLRQIISRKKDD